MPAPWLVPRRRAHDDLASAFAGRGRRRTALALPLGALLVLAAAVRPAGAQAAAAADTTVRGSVIGRPAAPGASSDSSSATAPRARALVGAAYLAAGGNGLPLGALDTRLRAAGLPGTAAGATTLATGTGPPRRYATSGT